jgi:hypothetical protein
VVLAAELSAAPPLSVLPHAAIDSAMTDAVERAKNFFIFIRNPPSFPKENPSPLTRRGFSLLVFCYI